MKHKNLGVQIWKGGGGGKNFRLLLKFGFPTIIVFLTI